MRSGRPTYQLAEIQRLRGELAEAEQSYRQARLAGRDPGPGMSLLRLAQGRIDLVLPAIRRALDEAPDPIARSRLLLALWYVEFGLLRFQDYATSTRPPPRRQRWRRRAGAVGGDARLSPSNYAHAGTDVKRPETLCVAPASGDDIAVVPHL